MQIPLELRLLRAYQQAIDVNIISSITDRKGIILHANKKFCEVSKYSSSELIGQNHSIVNSGHHPASFFKEMWKALGKGLVWHNEIKNKAKDGTFYWVDTVILPILNEDGIPESFLSLRYLIDIKKRAEEEKAEYTGKLKEMLHITSHKVRAPLATCLGLLFLMEKDQQYNEEEVRKMLAHLKKSAIELDNFTKELTQFMHDLGTRYNQ